MSDRFAPLHCPSTGFLRRSQARTGLSKAFTSIFQLQYIYKPIKNNQEQYD